MLILPPPNSPVWLVIVAFAVWRLTAMLYYEEGPFGCFRILRGLAGRAGLVRLVTCFHCLAVWVSVAGVLALYGMHLWAVPLILAVAGFASITERALGIHPRGHEGADSDDEDVLRSAGPSVPAE
jgi:hypothetical protein